MRINLVLDSLNELLAIASKSREDALLCLGSAEFLLGFLEKTAEANGISDLNNVRKYLREIRTKFHLDAGLIQPEDATPHPRRHAEQALGILLMNTLFDQKPELLQNNLTHDGTLLHD